MGEPMITVVAYLFRYRRFAFRIAAILLVIMGVVMWRNLHDTPKITQVSPIAKVIEIPVERIREKDVVKYVRVEDRAAVNALLQQNRKLNADVEQLTLALAQHTSSGSGTIVYTPPVPGSVGADSMYKPFKFNDYRLSLTSVDGINATYELNQRFSIVASTGRDKQNRPINIIKLFEIDNKEERHPITTTEITTIVPKQPGSHFYVQPSLQAGVGILPGTATTTQNSAANIIVAIPWLKRAKTETVETTRYAYLTPAVSVKGKTTVVGVMPVSINTGTFKYTPFSDIWVSPFAGINTATNKKELGLTVTATF